MKRIFEMNLGVDLNEESGKINYQVSGSVAPGAEKTFVGGLLINMVNALDRQSRALEARENAQKVIEVVDNITPQNPIVQNLEDKWTKK